jgi:phosphoglycolate phosphatase
MHVLFDLDGTLTDPKPGITRCIGYALECLGAGSVDIDSLGWCIGPPLRGSFERLLNTRDPELVASAIDHYRERFRDVGLFENAVYEGIPEALGTLKTGGATLHVATSKPETFAIRILERFGLAPFFDQIVGSELDGTREAKGEVIAQVLRLAQVDPAAAVMVGDRMHDVQGAREHGMPCVGVLFGYGEEEELASAGAWPLVSSPSEIPDAVADARSRHMSAVIP